MIAMSRATRACIVREHIQEGYGVEDIAVCMDIPLHIVRFEVDELRKSGTLKKPKAILAERAREIRGAG